MTDDVLFGYDELVHDAWGDSDMLGELMVDAVMPRSCSDMSLASTARGSAEPALVIAAFCTFNGALVHIDYPVAENGWMYRLDQGGYTTHRWDLAGGVSLVAKHNTCAKAMRTKSRLCRNCENKQIWRRVCQEACNTFFVFSLQDVEATVCTLSPLVLDTPHISMEDVQLYSAFAPKTPSSEPSSFVDPVRARKMMDRERTLRFSLLNGGTGRVNAVHHRRSHVEDDLFRLLLDADDGSTFGEPNASSAIAAACAADDMLLVDDAFSSVDHAVALNQPRTSPAALQSAFPPYPPCNLPTIEHAPFVLSAPFAPLTPTPVVPRAAPVLTTVISSPTRNRNIALTIYEAILKVLIESATDDTASMTADFLVDLLSQLPRNLYGISETQDNNLLTHLYGTLGVELDPVLLIKTSLLHLWVNEAASVRRGVCARIGFLSMHSTQTFDDLRNLPLMPCALTEREMHMHHSFQLAKSACLPGTRPVMCVYYLPHATSRVYAATVLPLGF